MVKMLTVDRFLCLELETGGIIIGRIGVVWPLLDVIASAYLYHEGILFTDASVKTAIISLINADACFLGFAIFSYKCVQGIKTRNPALLIPLMVWLALYAFVSFTFMFMFTTSLVINGLFFVPISSYFFVVIYSISQKPLNRGKCDASLYVYFQRS